MNAEIGVRQNTYFLSNEGAVEQQVGFDDLTVEHAHSPVLQQEEYYPFGLEFNSYSRGNSITNNYLFNGKEKQNDLNLNWLDFGARMYSADLGRWANPDSYADAEYSLTPFRYGFNNPIKFIDPDGNYERGWQQTENGFVTHDPSLISQVIGWNQKRPWKIEDVLEKAGKSKTFNKLHKNAANMGFQLVYGIGALGTRTNFEHKYIYLSQLSALTLNQAVLQLSYELQNVASADAFDGLIGQAESGFFETEPDPAYAYAWSVLDIEARSKATEIQVALELGIENSVSATQAMISPARQYLRSFGSDRTIAETYVRQYAEDKRQLTLARKVIKAIKRIPATDFRGQSVEARYMAVYDNRIRPKIPKNKRR